MQFLFLFLFLFLTATTTPTPTPKLNAHQIITQPPELSAVTCSSYDMYFAPSLAMVQVYSLRGYKLIMRDVVDTTTDMVVEGEVDGRKAGRVVYIMQRCKSFISKPVSSISSLPSSY